MNKIVTILEDKVMACIVYQTDKRTGIKYAYESISYWDKDKKQLRSKRKYLGKVDPYPAKSLPPGAKNTALPAARRKITTPAGPECRADK